MHPRSQSPLSVSLLVLAASAPSLLAYNASPSSTFLNQALALALWGLFVAMVGCTVGPARPDKWPWAAFAALAALAAGVAWSAVGPPALPAPFVLSSLGLLAAAAVLLASGAAARGASDAAAPMRWFCIAWVVAGVLNAGVAAVQVFAPDVADGTWIARSGLPGRAVGNLRQPNHLSSLLVWAAIALVPLLDAGRLRVAAAAALMALFMGAVVLTASRTGIVSIALLAAWGALDRGLARRTRALLLAAPLLYAAAWAGMWAWAHIGSHTFGGEARLAAGDISSSRFGIWANTIELIRQQPWTGVGWGNFNLAWSLTPFPGRPTAFFDHAHNLPLQLLVELGLPLGGAVLALLVAALWQAGRRSAGDAGARAAFVFVVMIGVHSLLEYPLWYAYFLLPAAWAWGYALGRPRLAVAAGALDRSGGAVAATPPAWGLAVAGGALLLGAALAVADYQRVVRIFEPGAGAAPLPQRIADGRRSWLFGHHADYAAATSGLPQPDGLRVFDRPAHYLLDTRLMVAWAQALAREGQIDPARHLAVRLREFGPARAEAFFRPCENPDTAAATPICAPPARPLAWRDFVPAH